MERFVKAKSHVLVRSEGSPLQFTLPEAAFLSLVFSSKNDQLKFVLDSLLALDCACCHHLESA